jgi:hypothetical protein
MQGIFGSSLNVQRISSFSMRRAVSKEMDAFRESWPCRRMGSGIPGAADHLLQQLSLSGFVASLVQNLFISRKMLNRGNIGEPNGTTTEANTRTHRQTTHLYFQLMAHP